MDLERAHLQDSEIEAVEELANTIVFENRPVVTQFVEPDKVAELDLRKAPTVERDIRIVEIEGFDRDPCGGTHCSRTGEVGAIAIRKRERRGQETRLEFLCGWRALRDHQWKTVAINELALAFSVKDRELPATVLRLVQEAADSRRTVNLLQNKLLTVEAGELLEEATLWNDTRVVLRAFGERSPEQVQRLASLLSEGHKTIVLLGASAGQARLFFACTDDMTTDMAALLRKTCATFGGGGGGQPHLAQGGGFPGEQVGEALDFAYKALTTA
jgi:alanyl-tRNA synthetase